MLKSGENSVLVKAEPSKQFSGLIGTFHIEFERSAVLEVMTDADGPRKARPSRS